MTVKTKAIVLIYPPSYNISPYRPSITDTKRSILSCCVKWGISVIKIITATDTYDVHAIKQFIIIAKEHGGAVSLIVNAPFPITFHYVPLWSIVGTLSIIGLINDVQIYDRWKLISNIRKEEVGSLKKINCDLIVKALSCFQEEINRMRAA